MQLLAVVSAVLLIMLLQSVGLFSCIGVETFEEFLIAESHYCRLAVIICTSAA